MKTLRFLMAMSMAVVGVQIHAQTNPPAEPALTGKVVDASGQPIAGAVVEHYQYDMGRMPFRAELRVREKVTTDANGEFRFSDSRTPGFLVARKPGLAVGWNQVAPGMPRRDQRLVLVAPGEIAGVVVDEGGKPVAGAEVAVLTAFSETAEEGGRRNFSYLSEQPARDCFSTRSGADGSFKIGGFPTNAAANLTASAPNKVLRQTQEQYMGPDSMQCRAGQTDVRLVLEPAGEIQGKIVAETEKGPLPVALLSLQPDGPGLFALGSRPPDQSNEDGTFVMKGLPAGAYRLRAQFGTNAVPDWVAETVPVSVEAGETKKGVEITAIRGGLLEVAVYNKDDHKPIGQINVNAFQQAYQAGGAANSNGVAVLRLVPGEYQVATYKEGWRTENTTATVETGKTNHVEVEVAPPPRIAGMVRQPNGDPATNLLISVVGDYSLEQAGLRTGPDGKFGFEWNAQRFGPESATSCVLVRDPAHNLAAAQDIDEETTSLELRLEPALVFAGKAECDGKPVTNATAALVFWTGNRGMHLSGFTTKTNVPGQFEIPALPPGRRYGLYVSAPGYGQKYLDVGEQGEAKRVELDAVELRLAKMKLAGKVVDMDDKPVVNAYVHLSGEDQPNGNVRTDSQGRFAFDHVCEGTVRLFSNSRNANGSVAAEAGDTNVVLKLGEQFAGGGGGKPQKVKGVVTGPDGKPVAGAQIAVFPMNGQRRYKTDTNGAFGFTFTIEPWQRQMGGPTLMVRDFAGNLAGTEDLSEESTNLTIQLKPAWTLSGRVEGADGHVLTNSQVGVLMMVGRMSSQVDDQTLPTDREGRFRIPALPAGQDYTVFARAKGYGQSQQKVQVDSETNRVELPPFALKIADQVIAGQVLNPNDKPAAGVHVNLSGEDQPPSYMATDSKGRFKFQVCEGTVHLFASSQTGHAQTTASSGETNVVLQLARMEPGMRQAPRRPSLMGKPLPDLKPLGLAAAAVPAGKPVLVCLMDIQQRPSRRLARLLVEQNEAHRNKGLTVLAIQAAPSGGEALEEWQSATLVPFPVGRVPEQAGALRWASALESLPWLILTDKSGKVVAEGFPLDELDGKLEEFSK